MDSRRARAKTVGDGKRSTPRRRCNGSTHGGKQRLRIALRNRQHRNLGDRGRIFDGQALCVSGGADARRERIAGVKRHVRDAAALYALLGAIRALREDAAFGVAIVVRIGIDQAADRAVLGRDLGLDAAPRASIASDDDRALY